MPDDRKDGRLMLLWEGDRPAADGMTGVGRDGFILLFERPIGRIQFRDDPALSDDE
jgi:hypothetical protein